MVRMILLCIIFRSRDPDKKHASILCAIHVSMLTATHSLLHTPFVCSATKHLSLIHDTFPSLLTSEMFFAAGLRVSLLQQERIRSWCEHLFPGRTSLSGGIRHRSDQGSFHGQNTLCFSSGEQHFSHTCLYHCSWDLPRSESKHQREWFLQWRRGSHLHFVSCMA
jgi:hypothetical protein